MNRFKKYITKTLANRVYHWKGKAVHFYLDPIFGFTISKLFIIKAPDGKRYYQYIDPEQWQPERTIADMQAKMESKLNTSLPQIIKHIEGVEQSLKEKDFNQSAYKIIKLKSRFILINTQERILRVSALNYLERGELGQIPSDSAIKRKTDSWLLNKKLLTFFLFRGIRLIDKPVPLTWSEQLCYVDEEKKHLERIEQTLES